MSLLQVSWITIFYYESYYYYNLQLFLSTLGKSLLSIMLLFNSIRRNINPLVSVKYLILNSWKEPFNITTSKYISRALKNMRYFLFKYFVDIFSFKLRHFFHSLNNPSTKVQKPWEHKTGDTFQPIIKIVLTLISHEYLPMSMFYCSLCFTFTV